MPSARTLLIAVAVLAGVVVVIIVAASRGRPERGDRSRGESQPARSPSQVRLQGRGDAVAPSAAQRHATPPPVEVDGPLPPADPWLRADAGVPSGSVEPKPARYGPFPCAQVYESGKLTFGETSWTAGPARLGFELASYDVTLLAPPSRALAPSAVGLTDKNFGSPSRSPGWWERLVEEIVRAVGLDNWTTDDALIAWDAARATLYVRQDARGHAQIAETLAHRAVGRLDVLRLVVLTEPGTAEAAERLAVDVPWGRTVCAQRGQAWAYLQDYDVEVGQGWFSAVPIVGSAETGIGVSARRIEQGEGPGILAVQVGTAAGPPRIQSWETMLVTFVPVTIELLEFDDAFWRGRISATPGEHSVVLANGRRVTLVVEEPRCGPRPEPPFIRRVLAPPRRLAVTWMAPGPLAGKALTIPLDAFCAYGGGSFERGQSTVDLQARTVDAAMRTCPWPLQEGGVHIQAAVLAAGEVDVVDLLVQRSDPALDMRESAPCLREALSNGEHRRWSEPLSLPICRVRVDTRRVYVPVGGEVTVRLDEAANGTFRISLPRGE